MRNAAAIVVTAVALAAGSFLLGYAWSEWLIEQPAVRVEGWVWRVHYTLKERSWVETRWLAHEVVRNASAQAEIEVEEFDLASWKECGQITATYVWCVMPGRTRDVRLVTMLDPLRSGRGVEVYRYLYVDPEDHARWGVHEEPGQGTYRVKLLGRGPGGLDRTVRFEAGPGRVFERACAALWSVHGDVMERVRDSGAPPATWP